MANAGAIRAGRAFIELFADATKLDAGLRAAGMKIKAWGNGIKEVGTKMAFLGAAIVAPITLAASKIAELDDAQKRLDFQSKTGVAVSESDVATAKEFSVALAGIGAHLSLIAVKLAGAVMPIIERFSEWIESVSGPIKEWIDNNESLVQTIFMVGAGVTVVGAGLVVLGTSVSLLGSAIAGLGLLAGAVFSPLGVAIAAVVAGLYALGGFNGLGEKLKAIFGGISKAIMSGDIQLAWDIVCKGIELSWVKLLDSMASKLSRFARENPLLAAITGADVAGFILNRGAEQRGAEIDQLQREFDEMLRKAGQPTVSARSQSTSKEGGLVGNFLSAGQFGGALAGQSLGANNQIEKLGDKIDKTNGLLTDIRSKIDVTRVA